MSYRHLVCQGVPIHRPDPRPRGEPLLGEQGPPSVPDACWARREADQQAAIQAQAAAERADSKPPPAPAPWTPKVGDRVMVAGGVHAGLAGVVKTERLAAGEYQITLDQGGRCWRRPANLRPLPAEPRRPRVGDLVEIVDTPEGRAAVKRHGGLWNRDRDAIVGMSGRLSARWRADEPREIEPFGAAKWWWPIECLRVIEAAP